MGRTGVAGSMSVIPDSIRNPESEPQFTRLQDDHDEEKEGIKVIL